MLRQRSFTLLMLALMLAGVQLPALAQTEKYDVRQVKFYLFDKNGTPWNDTSAFIGIRLDAGKRESLEDQEISAGTITYAVGEDYKRYTLKQDVTGACVAEVPFVVYKNSDQAINYEATMLKKEGDRYISVPLTTRSLAVTRNSGELKATATIFRPLLLKDWLLYGGIMLASALFAYFALFRWLFSVLLFSKNWPVSRAEYFTTSLSLLVIIGVFGLLLALVLPQTLIMLVALAVLAVFWVGHAVMWALS
ncbi:MAG: hypothetical protein AB1489_19910 [Acidobacteriota bacterium]